MAALTLPDPSAPLVEFNLPGVATKITREVTKEFVRRPAKGWTDSTPVAVVRFDHHCAIWEQP